MLSLFDAPEPKVATPKDVHEIISASIPSTFDLSKLHNRATDIHMRSEDFLFSDFSNQNPFMSMLPDGELNLYADSVGSSSLPCGQTLSPYAFRQLCTKIGVPARYVEKCIAGGMTTLALNNLNSWLKLYKGSMFVRSTDEEIRGLLSSRYSVLDSHEILEVLENTIDEDEYKIKGYFLSPERFHLRLVQKQMMDTTEDLFAGIQIDSSDVGRSVLNVSFMIFKQVCTNGMIVSKGQGTLFQQRHVGIEASEFYDSLSLSFSQIPALVESTSKAIRLAKMDYIKANDLGDTYEEMSQSRFLRPFNFPASAIEDILSIWQNTIYTPTKWGLLNAITEHSQKYTLERRIVIEEQAGRLLIA